MEMNRQAVEKRPYPRLLGVFAHPDDETFCIGGTLARYISQGAEAMVVSFTRGEAGQIRDAKAATRRTLGKVRATELHAACTALGVQHIHCYDYGDGKLQDLPPDQLVEPIVRLIREFQPDVVFTFDEFGAYGHPDHIAISEATTKACQLAGQSQQFADQLRAGLAPFDPPRLFHTCFPQSGLLLLDLIVQWLQSLDARFRGSEDFMHGLMLFADESTMLGYASDHIKVEWYPANFYLIEQGEPATSLYLLLSGSVNVLREDEAGNLQLLESLGPGTFIGDTGIAYGQPRNAHVVAVRNATCLVFSPGKPTNFAGRGEEAQFAAEEMVTSSKQPAATLHIDVSDFIEQKILALTKHRTQYPIEPDMFPAAFLKTLMGQEYFVQIDHPRSLETTLFPESQSAKE